MVSVRRALIVGMSLASLPLLLPIPANAADAGEATPSISTVPVVPRTGIGNNRFQNLLHGSNWRLLWNTPIKLPILNLREFAGGVQPIGEGGDHLSKTLLFQGADGRQYLFVKLAKEPERGLSPKLLGSGVEDVARADTASLNPVAELMMPPLLEAVGLPHVRPRLVVLPKDQALLGRFCDEFCGVAGTIEEHPQTCEASPKGFMGAQKIAGSRELLMELDRDSGNRVDARAYLKARLVDILVGDGDRMPDQWTWAGYGVAGARRWVPVPIRHYQAFSRQSGPLSITPHLQDFGAQIPDIKKLTASAQELDRRVLPQLSRNDWREVARELRLALTDSVIAEAIRQMPPEMYAIEGRRLESELISRRDRIEEASARFYRLSMKVVEIHASAMGERIAVHRFPGGGVEIELRRKASDEGATKEPPLLRRTFLPDETLEVRIRNGAGGDDILIDGPVDKNAIVVRIVDGRGVARFEDRTTATSGNPTKKLNYIYDAGRESAVEAGPYTAEAKRRMPFNPKRPDSGSELTAGLSTAQINYSSDYAAMAGWGLEFDRYGFDDDPYKFHGELNGAVAMGNGFRYRFGAMTDIVTLLPNASLHLEATTSTLENLSFYGLGNETRPVRPGIEESDFETRSNSTTLFASFRYPPRFSHSWFCEAGIEAKWISTSADAGSFFDRERERFVGSQIDFTSDLQVGFHYDSRESGREIALTPRSGNGRPIDRRALASSAALSGMSMDIVGRYYPESIGNSSAFGKLNTDFRVFVPLNETRWSRIAFRIGGQKNWGSPPWFEAATVGGSSSIRGFDRNRFAGDASMYANTELRLYTGEGRLIVPILYGPLLFVDTGRVYLAGESSSQWHTGIGGGVWVAFFESRYSAQLSVARGLDQGRLTGGYGIYALAGFSF